MIFSGPHIFAIRFAIDLFLAINLSTLGSLMDHV